VTKWGEGLPVLLLHGNPGSGMMWEGIAALLGARCRCVAPDLPGFGHSEVPTDDVPSLDGMARFVEQLLRAADIKPPIDLIAHDFGGPFAFTWAVKHSDSVRRIAAPTKRDRKRKADTAAAPPAPAQPNSVAGTPLRIPYGNKDVAMKLGARYCSAGWYAPPGVDLSAFGERGWL
jgi:pimeloyl-ACP methyl ester carboxylesterase